MKIKSKMYSKTKVNWAGDVLKDVKSYDMDEVLESIEILRYWRALHTYPLRAVRARLYRRSSDIDRNAFAVYRLKRHASITRKLTRNYEGKKATMKMSQMQDVAGCRAVLQNMELVEKLYKKFSRETTTSEKIYEKNYVVAPKDDGYRSIHMIFKYKNKKYPHLDGLRVEVQLRTVLQHVWATAVETVDLFTNQEMKFNYGNKEWGDFFRLMSSAFAIIEGTQNTSENRVKLYSDIARISKKLDVVNKMETWTDALRFIEKGNASKDNVYLLKLNPKDRTVHVTSYYEDDIDIAINDYSREEEKSKDDIVLVRAGQMNELKKAYPNYFADTREFLKRLRAITDGV